MASDAMVRCPSCEKYVWKDAAHSCYNAKQVRAVRDAEAAVIACAEAYVAIVKRQYTEAYAVYKRSHDDLADAVTALHAARQGVQHGE